MACQNRSDRAGRCASCPRACHISVFEPVRSWAPAFRATLPRKMGPKLASKTAAGLKPATATAKPDDRKRITRSTSLDKSAKDKEVKQPSTKPKPNPAASKLMQPKSIMKPTGKGNISMPIAAPKNSKPEKKEQPKVVATNKAKPQTSKASNSKPAKPAVRQETPLPRMADFSFGEETPVSRNRRPVSSGLRNSGVVVNSQKPAPAANESAKVGPQDRVRVTICYTSHNDGTGVKFAYQGVSMQKVAPESRQETPKTTKSSTLRGAGAHFQATLNNGVRITHTRETYASRARSPPPTPFVTLPNTPTKASPQKAILDRSMQIHDVSLRPDEHDLEQVDSGIVEEPEEAGAYPEPVEAGDDEPDEVLKEDKEAILRAADPTVADDSADGQQGDAPNESVILEQVYIKTDETPEKEDKVLPENLNDYTMLAMDISETDKVEEPGAGTAAEATDVAEISIITLSDDEDEEMETGKVDGVVEEDRVDNAMEQAKIDVELETVKVDEELQLGKVDEKLQLGKVDDVVEQVKIDEELLQLAKVDDDDLEEDNAGEDEEGEAADQTVLYLDQLFNITQCPIKDGGETEEDELARLEKKRVRELAGAKAVTYDPVVEFVQYERTDEYLLQEHFAAISKLPAHPFAEIGMKLDDERPSTSRGSAQEDDDDSLIILDDDDEFEMPSIDETTDFEESVLDQTTYMDASDTSNTSDASTSKIEEEIAPASPRRAEVSQVCAPVASTHDSHVVQDTIEGLRSRLEITQHLLAREQEVRKRTEEWLAEEKRLREKFEMENQRMLRSLTRRVIECKELSMVLKRKSQEDPCPCSLKQPSPCLASSSSSSMNDTNGSSSSPSSSMDQSRGSASMVDAGTQMAENDVPPKSSAATPKKSSIRKQPPRKACPPPVYRRITRYRARLDEHTESQDESFQESGPSTPL